MRTYILWVFVFGLMVYAWRNWFVSLCALILLTVIMQHRSFPTYLLGINGMNPWNLLLLTIVFVWFLHRRSTKAPFDIPRNVTLLLVVCFLMFFISYVRAVVDLGSFPVGYRPNFIGFTGEFLINRIKFLVPAVLLFDACRTRQRVRLAAMVVLACAVAYAVLVIKYVPISSLFSSSESVFMQVRHKVDQHVGLMAIDMSMLLAGMFWALLAFTVLAVKRRWMRLLLLCPLAAIFVGMALCHSRGSYMGFAAGGLVLAIVRWRWLLVLLPMMVVPLFIAMPSIPARLGMGLGVADVSGEVTQEWNRITSGRTTTIWPAAMEEIEKHSVLGFGGEATRRSGLSDRISTSHPHNAYLEALLDMGLVGLVTVIALYGAIFAMTLSLFRNREDRLAAAVGGMGLATISVLLVTAMGAQSFYPTQSTILPWCIWALGLRMRMHRAQGKQTCLQHPTDLSATSVS